MDVKMAELPRGQEYDLIMKLNDAARLLIGSAPATLVTTNRDGSAQVSVVWMGLQTTPDGEDELVTAHLKEHQKIRNIRRDPGVAADLVSNARSGAFPPCLSVEDTAPGQGGGARELLVERTR